MSDAKSNYKIISQCCNINPVCKFRDPFVADWLINGQQKNSLENLVILNLFTLIIHFTCLTVFKCLNYIFLVDARFRFNGI